LKNILFISYDGMTDPLGQSQVLPYLTGLSKRGYKFTLLSCEKPERFAQHEALIRTITQNAGIDWQPISFTASPPILAKYYDLYRLQKRAEELHKEKNFAMAHCRSYVSAAIGLKLKEKFGLKFFFDMRGFWVDERVDGGLWKLDNPIYKLAYKSYKKKEAEYIRKADMIVSLTEAGKREMQTWPSYSGTPIGVIPCSADFNLFELVTPERKLAGRKALGLPTEGLVVSYLGSISMWYMLDEMLELFALIKERIPGTRFLFITAEPAEVVFDAARKHNLTDADLVVRSAKRQEVPLFTGASDLNVFFIKQSYSKIASSPTKLGEILAMGIPVVCNDKVGDVAEIVAQADAGLAISEFSRPAYEQVVKAIPELLAKDPAQIRARALGYYSLDNAIASYAELYRQTIG
jgi:glycosyltransferase involved in cell wall biosynthesis